MEKLQGINFSRKLWVYKYHLKDSLLLECILVVIEKDQCTKAYIRKFTIMWKYLKIFQ